MVLILNIINFTKIFNPECVLVTNNFNLKFLLVLLNSHSFHPDLGKEKFPGDIICPILFFFEFTQCG